MNFSKDLIDYIESKLFQFEAQGQYSADILSLMKENELLGHENYNDPKDLVEKWEKSAYLDGSFGWIVISTGLAATNCNAFLNKEGRKHLFEESKDLFFAGQYAPKGRAKKEGEFYNISGHWSFCSGLNLATHIVAGFIILDENNKVTMDTKGVPIIKVGVFTKDQIEVKENWDVLGLKATGSHDYIIKNQQIHESLVFDFPNAFSEESTKVNDLGLLTLSAISHGSWALGASRRMLDDLVKLAFKKRFIGETSPIPYRPTFQLNYAQKEALYHSSKSFLLNSIDNLIKSIEMDVDSTLINKQRSLVSLACSNANQSASLISNFVHESLGSSSIRSGENRIDKSFRDIQSGIKHIMVNEESYISASKVLFEL